MTRSEEIYHSIITTYRHDLWSKFVKGLKTYDMIQKGDKICVCISGGKDSMTMAVLFKLLHMHTEIPFDIEYLVMNPGYNEINLQVIKNNLKALDIPAKIVETNIFDIANSTDHSPCYLCAKMRRGALYRIAHDLGCNKIALGHHYDDVIETTLMNLLNSGSFQTMLPKVHSENYSNMELIRPMYFIREKDIIRFRNANNLQFIQCACRFTENCGICDNGGVGSQRLKTKYLIHKLMEEYSPYTEKNLFRAGENVNMDMILGYKENGIIHNFNEIYEEKGKEIKKRIEEDKREEKILKENEQFTKVSK